MSEKEKLSSGNLKHVSGGGCDKEKETVAPRLVDPGDLFNGPMYEYTCENCGKKYKFRQKGNALRKACVMRTCPYCGE